VKGEYEAGESSGYADWVLALGEVLPDDFGDVTPSGVAAYVASVTTGDVFVLTSGEYEDESIVGVFTTREAAAGHYLGSVWDMDGDGPREGHRDLVVGTRSFAESLRIYRQPLNPTSLERG
jgi:hypothetical protein